MNTRTIDFNELSRVLVIKLRHHGDVLLTSPVIQVLQNHYPHLEIDALVYEDTRDMLSGHPALVNLFTIDRAWKELGVLEQSRYENRLTKSLISRNYDLLIHLTEHNRGLILTRRLKPRYSVTAQWKNKSWLWKRTFTHHYPVPQKLRHTVEKHLDALRHLGLQPAQDERKLIFNPGDEATSSAESILAEHGLADKPYLLFHPTSRWMFKSWDTNKAGELIDMLNEQGHSIVITSAPSEVEMNYVEQMLSGVTRPVINLAGKTNLKELGALIGHAACFIGMDSVPMHLAAAMNTPTVTLFGPSGDQEWGPWMVKHRTITHDISCRPCGLDGCGGGKVSDCLMQIQPQTVFASVQEVLNND
jgi:heptosyltransferase-3